MAIRVGILTVSDRSSRGERADATHEAIREALASGPYEVVAYEVVPDEVAQVRRVLRLWADRDSLDLILTNGGTGLGVRDHTPEATLQVVDRQVPGLAELVRNEGVKKTPMAALSRGVAGVRGSTLIINLPGSPRGARESAEALLAILPHAIEQVTGRSIPGGHEHE